MIIIVLGPQLSKRRSGQGEYSPWTIHHRHSPGCDCFNAKKWEYKPIKSSVVLHILIRLLYRWRYEYIILHRNDNRRVGTRVSRANKLTHITVVVQVVVQLIMVTMLVGYLWYYRLIVQRSITFLLLFVLIVIYLYPFLTLTLVACYKQFLLILVFHNVILYFHCCYNWATSLATVY